MEIIREALFCAGTENYCIPQEPNPGDIVTVRFRTGRGNVDHVYYIEKGREQEMVLEEPGEETAFDYFMIEISAWEEPISYHFKIVKGQDVCFYSRLGVAEEETDEFDFVVTPGFSTPQWAKGAVMYQIFIDRFCNGDPSNDPLAGEYFYIGWPVTHIENWDALPETFDVGRFYGGDLQGVWDKLDYIQGLGVEAIYFNPIFVSPSNHKYDCQDYEHIDPHLTVIPRDEGELIREGDFDNRNAERYMIRTANKDNLEASDQFFARFVEEVHRRGMKVILDGVFNHCGSFNKWMDGEEIYQREGGYEEGAFLSPESPYRSFFKFADERPEAWPCNRSYDGWWGHDTLPKLNYENSDKLVEYILDIGRRWISPPFNVDGWRLDVAADLGYSEEYNHKFWRKFRKAVKEINPEVLILAEHYGDNSGWLNGDQWDSVMNYDAFMEPVTWFLTGMEKHSDSSDGGLLGNGRAFFDTMMYHMSRMQVPSLDTAMNQLSNHDHSRFLTRTNRKVGRINTLGAEAASQGVRVEVLRQAVLIQMTWPGAPTVYYGDEAGVCGWTDPDSRRTYPWGHENLELIEYHRYMISFHKRLIVLRLGAVKELQAEKDFIAYGRLLGEYRAVVAVNCAEETRHFRVPVWQLGIEDGHSLARLMLTTKYDYNVGVISREVKNGYLELVLPPVSGVLYINHADRFFAVFDAEEAQAGK